MSEIEEPWRPMPPGPGDRGCYCKGKLILKVVDMLTYPRPVRKFEVRGRAGAGYVVRDIFSAKVCGNTVRGTDLVNAPSGSSGWEREQTMHVVGYAMLCSAVTGVGRGHARRTWSRWCGRVERKGEND